jgi:hypothetical protein
MNTKPPPPLPPILTWQSCRNFKSLPFCKQRIFQRDFFTKGLRKKSATSNPARNSYHWTPNPLRRYPVCSYTKVAEISNRFRSANNGYFYEISPLNACEKSRQQVPQQETSSNEHQTTSAATPYVNMAKLPEFQIAPVQQKMII